MFVNLLFCIQVLAQINSYSTDSANLIIDDRSWSEYIFEPSRGFRFTFNDVFFLDDNFGWIIGNEGNNEQENDIQDGLILRTVDGGKSWKECYVQLDVAGGINQMLAKVHFSDPLNGSIVGSKGLLLLTKDGGQSWKMVTDDVLGSHDLTSVYMLNNNSIFIGTKNKILLSKDGGTKWAKSYEFDKTLGVQVTDITFLNEDLGFMTLNWRNAYLKFEDGEYSMNQARLGYNQLFCVDFLSAEHLVIGSDNRILLSKDLGKNWMEFEKRYTVNDFAIVDDSSVFVASRQIYELDLNSNAYTLSFNVVRETIRHGDVRAIALKPDGSGFAVGRDGTIVKYE